ncbi:MAG: HAMP domain-containing protein [Rhodobacteraceae bacterium]|nr:HAMP domain-containing protein [Paracoccaceae bacterium]
MWTVVTIVLGVVLSLPFAGLYFFKFYANQLVQQTEESLLAQASIMAAIYAQSYEVASGTETASAKTNQEFDPTFPSLSMSAGILPQRPDAVPNVVNPSPIYLDIGPELSRVASAAQINTLAGYRFLDDQGNVIGGSAEVGQSLAHVEEVQRALEGENVSVARVRVRDTPEPTLYSFSRGARVRVFVATPVRSGGDVIGAVYLSRTPNHIFRFLYGERFNLAKASLFVLISTSLIGFVFWRFITRPIHALIARTQTTGSNGQRWQPLEHYGTREIETLSHSFQSLTERLQNKQDALKTYTAHVTHELKSPLTAVKGAAELLAEEDMTPSQRRVFLENIARNTQRMEELLTSMRAFSLADQSAMAGETRLKSIVPDLSSRFDPVRLSVRGAETALPIHTDTLKIILTHLLENAQQHGATEVTLIADRETAGATLTISDNGNGISDGNRDKVLTPFFTTRREQGGTGMGLNIVTSTLEALGGSLTLLATERGTAFRISFQNAPK